MGSDVIEGNLKECLIVLFSQEFNFLMCKPLGSVMLGVGNPGKENSGM